MQPNPTKTKLFQVRGQTLVHLVQANTYTNLGFEIQYNGYTTLCGTPVRKTALVTDEPVNCPDCLSVFENAYR